MVVELPNSHEVLEIFVVLYSSMKLEELIESFVALKDESCACCNSSPVLFIHPFGW